MSSIVDNSKDNLLVSHVNKLLDNAEFSRMAVGYFYLSGFEAIREKLHKIKHLRLLIGNRTNQQTIEELVKGHINKELTENEIRKQNLLNSKQRKQILDLTKNEYSEDLALMEQNTKNEDGLSALWELIRDKRIDIKVFTKGTLHSKAYIFDLPERNYLEGIAIVGSSNLSISGLRNNSELNVKVTNPNDYKEVRGWFDKLWDESEDFNEIFMSVVEESWFKKEVTPYDVYIKTLYNLVKERIEIKEHSSLTAFDQSKLYPFQKDAYNRALTILENEETAYNGVFISDVVGLGKSYIAIALMSYYWSIRQKSTLVVCPASLRKMWEDYRDEFHLRCKILPYSELLYQDENEQYTLNDDPEYDGYGVIVIDESHNFRNPDTQRYKILAPFLQGKKVILLTATPQNNTVWDLYHQIKLFHQSDVTDISITPNNLKKYFNEYDESPEKIQELLQHFLIRRTRRDIINSPKYTDWVSLNKFPDRKLHTLDYNIEETYSSVKQNSIYEVLLDKLFRENKEDRYHYSIYNLTGFVKKNLKSKREYIGLSNTGEWVRGLLRVLLFKRLESSVEAFYLSIQRMLNRHSILLKSIELGFIITGKAEQLELFLDGGDENADESKVNKYSVDDFEIEKLKSAINADIAILESVLKLVEPIYQDEKKDKKFASFVKNVIEKHKEEKILIFSEFSDTVHYLHKNLQRLYSKIPITRISSHTANSDEKANIIRRFSPKSQTKAGLGQYEKEVQILITTDVLSEGQNLQDCSIVVNYDFHWNPVRLIQRIGRVDRIGSEADTIHVYNFLPDRKIDHELVLKDRVQNRINEIQQIFGLDSKILTQDEILNDKSVFAIYSEKDDNVLDAEDNITTIYDKAEQILFKLKKDNLEEYERITNLKDGIRTGRSAMSKGTYAYLSSGNLHRVYLLTGGKINENVGEVLRAIEAKPNEPQAVKIDTIHHNEELKRIYDRFKEELRKRQSEIESNQITTEQRYFLERLQASFNLFNNNPFLQKKIDELYNVFRKEIPDYAKSQLRRMRKENPPDDVLVDALQRLIETARILPFQEKELESEKMIVRTICSEGFK
ncbi:MAG: helicase-related protein [Bacteroidota bacterium]|nr:helicase-related protein [Bacteroidota bacterium]